MSHRDWLSDHAAAYGPILHRHRDWLEGDPTPRIFECEAGWSGLLGDLFDAVGAHVRGDNGTVRVCQIKEKYGTLRVYWTAFVASDVDRQIDALVDVAEMRSAIECEVCGRPARLRGQRWVQTVCDRHAAEKGLE